MMLKIYKITNSEAALNRNPKFYFKLFLNTFQLSAFTFGGGYVIVPLMKKQFVEKLGWIDEKTMLDFTALAQSSPGMISVNASVLVGHHLAGLAGAMAAVFGTILPPLILLSIIAACYSAFASNSIIRNVLEGMQSGVCAVIIDVVIGMASTVVKAKKLTSILIMIGAFIAAAVLRVNVIYIILACAVLGLIEVAGKKGGEAK